MGGEWRVQTFADLVGGRENIIGGPFGSNLTQADYTSYGVPVIRGSNMGRAGRYVGGEFAYVASEKADELSSNQVQAGDLVVTQRGTMGQVSIVPLSSVDRYVVSQSQMGVRVKDADPMFIYYLLCSPPFVAFLEGAVIQTGVPHINMGLLRNWIVAAPTIRLQERIGGLLSVLDDKIELNRQMAETLEAMARALFKTWFVDFDPVHARAEGCPTSLRDDLTALFPDNFGNNGLPMDWDKQSISGLGQFLNGLALQKYPAGDDESSLPVIKIAELRTGPTSKSDRASASVPSDYIVQDGDHLFSWSGSLMHCRWSYGIGALNQHLFKVTARSCPSWFLYQAVEHFLPEFRSIASDKAVTMGHIQRRHLDEAKIAVPHSALMEAAGHMLGPIHDRVLMLALQCRTLATLRDTLLPKLISGELRIGDAEQRVAAA